MKKLLYVGLLGTVLLSTGCSHGVNAGENSVNIGEISVRKQLVSVGENVNDTLIVNADENGNTVISAGKGQMENITFYLSEKANVEFSDYLSKLISWGDIAKTNAIETNKLVGSVSTNAGFAGGTTLLHISFMSVSGGNDWAGKFDICKIRSAAQMAFGPTNSIGSDPCEKKVSMYALQESILKLKGLLAKVPEYSSKAASSKSKSNLLN